MVRILPLFLILLIVAGAWRRESVEPKRAARTPEVRKAAVVPKIIEDCDVAAPEAPATVVTVPSSPRLRPGGEGRERRLAQQVAALEVELREALEKVDQLRAALAKVLNRRGPDVEEFLTQALIDSRTRVAVLEAQIDVIEAAYVELVARLRRSD